MLCCALEWISLFLLLGLCWCLQKHNFCDWPN